MTSGSWTLPLEQTGKVYLNYLSDWQTRNKLVEFEMLQTYDRNNSIGRFPRIDELEPEFARKVVAGIAQLAL